MKDYKVTAIQVLSSAALFAAGVFIPILAREELNASDFEVGIVVALYGIALFISAFVFGRAADIHGRRPYLIIGLFVSGLACFLQVFTPNLLTLILVRVILGFCGGIFPSALAAYAYERGVKMGKFTSYSGLGFGCGAIVAGLIVLFWGESGQSLGRTIYNPVFIGCGVMFFICFAIILKTPFPPTQKFKIPFIPMKIIKDNLSVYVSLLIRHTGACAVWAFFSLFIYFMQPAGTPEFIRFFWVGLINGVNGIFQYVFMQYIDRYDYKKLIISGFIISAIVFLLFVFVTDVFQLLLTQIILALAWSCLYVGSICLIMDRNPEHATSAGLLNSTINGAQVIGPLLGGVIASTFATYSISIWGFTIGGTQTTGYIAIMYIAMILSIIALIVYLIGLKMEKRPENKTETNNVQT